ncbi:hypothetical protein NW762_013308 [Fusarium torreyae]|uniref:Uncharacterized protein n=1 Tax=Fusarium torreyae TaxID=1237075 RepID=A0A9W8RKX6_9HYPO|nr:hypothetical protein NW762_013308 [Fusarium torreyae]
MSHNLSDNHASVNDYHLSMKDFEGEIRKRHPTWRREQVKRVLSSFERARSVMSPRAIQEIHQYLSGGKWISDSSCASSHPAYSHLRGWKPHDAAKKQFYYPYFLVVQAIYPQSDGVQKVAEELSQHWAISFDWTKPWYPRLDNPVREHALIMGRPANHENTPGSAYNSDLGDIESPASCIDVSRDPKPDEAQPKPQDQSNTTGDGHPLRGVHSQLEESEKRLSAVRSDAEKIRGHVMKAKDLAKRSDHHATAALEGLDALMERLNGNSKQPTPDDGNNERRNKRARKN